MEFGKVDLEGLDDIDFSLGADSPETLALLRKNKRDGKPHIFIGCAKWGRKDWVGTIYPLGTKEKDFLELYSKQFNSIELNATFYRVPSEKQIGGWKEVVKPGFKFCPKFNEKISHQKRLKEVDDLTKLFLERMLVFESNLGPIFLQTPPNYAVKNYETLVTFLQSLPKHLEIFVELRHPGWYSDSQQFKDTFSMFSENNIGAIITDAAGRRDCAHMRLTTNTAFIRFVGNNLHPSDYERCNLWAQKLKSWIDLGLDSVYFFMHQTAEVYSPRLCQYFIQQLNQAGDFNIPEPHMVS